MFSAAMSYKLVVVYVCIAAVLGAPMQLPVLPMPMQYGMQPQLPFLKHMLPNLQSPSMYPQQPLVIVVPNAPTSAHNEEDRYVNLNEQETNLKNNAGQVDENKDAIVIDANPKTPETQTRNAVVYLPDEGRYSIGTIISYIPFLPIEVNVPETISWIYNLINGGWFRPQGQMPMGSMKTLTKAPVPVIVMPYPGLLPQSQ